MLGIRIRSSEMEVQAVLAGCSLNRWRIHTISIPNRPQPKDWNKCPKISILKVFADWKRKHSAVAKPQLRLGGGIRQGNQLLRPSQSAAFISLRVLVLMDSPLWRRRVIKLLQQTSIRAIHLSKEPDSGFSGSSATKPLPPNKKNPFQE